MTTGPKEPLDQELEALRAGYREQATEQPPEMLDRAILNRARRAVEPRAERPWNFGWMHATATAALVVIGLAVILELRSTTAPEAVSPETGQQELPAAPIVGTQAPDTLDDRANKALGDSEVLERTERQQELRRERISQDQAAPATEQDAVSEPVSRSRQDMPAESEEAFSAPLALESADEETPARAQRPLFSKSVPPERRIEQILEWKRYEDERWQPALEQFVSDFPDHELPEELRDALEPPRAE